MEFPDNLKPGDRVRVDGDEGVIVACPEEYERPFYAYYRSEEDGLEDYYCGPIASNARRVELVARAHHALPDARIIIDDDPNYTYRRTCVACHKVHGHDPDCRVAAEEKVRTDAMLSKLRGF